ncbi:MAG TPA: ATP-binding protein, partial [Gemmatimonadaceae bacterium]|nr:ATP-binding protein [Gemmatimonadaceae bacterium]
YARTGDPSYLTTARAALAVPIADRRAREALQRGTSAHHEIATRALIEGGLNPRDAPVMARLFPLLEAMPRSRRAIDVWASADTLIDSMAVLIEDVALARQRDDSLTLQSALQRLLLIDDRLTTHEEEFSRALADASRAIPRLVLAAGVVLGALLVGLGVLLAYRLDRVKRAADQAAQRHLAELRTLVQDAPDVISRYDRELRHLYVNDAIERATGHPPSFFIGRTHEELVSIGYPADAVRRWGAALARVFETGTEQSITFEVAADNGAVRTFECRLAPEKSPDGHVLSVVGVARDISALRASQAALREAEAQLQRAQKLESVGQLAGGMAHEFNNVLTAVIGHLEVGREELPESHPTRRDIDEALSAARRATRLTRQLLTFGRSQLLDIAVVDPNALLDNVGAMLRRLLGERIALLLDLDPACPAVRVDPGQLQQVVLNLVMNARDAMQEGGTITVFSGTTELQRGAHSRWVTIAVQDTGSGMDEATSGRIFEPFFTTKPSGEGSGLGLSVVHGIVTQAGGFVRVDTQQGRGTTITVHLPAHEDASAAAPTALVAPAAARRVQGGESILVVDDEPSVRSSMRRILERAGYVVTEAQSAEDALTLWRRHAGHFDLVVTDFMMPGRTGVELLAALSEERPGLRGLLVSGYTGSEVDVAELARQVPAGAPRPRLATLRKPFARDELLLRVRSLLDAEGGELT